MLNTYLMKVYIYLHKFVSRKLRNLNHLRLTGHRNSKCRERERVCVCAFRGIKVVTVCQCVCVYALVCVSVLIIPETYAEIQTNWVQM